jgi:hypothetical protein
LLAAVHRAFHHALPHCTTPHAQRHIGRFKDEVDAARAYDKAAHFLYGPRAVLNFSLKEAAEDTSKVRVGVGRAERQRHAADVWRAGVSRPAVSG